MSNFELHADNILTRRLTSDTMQPEWLSIGVPLCNESCPSHDGKRCELMGCRPDEMCQPAVMAMYEIALESLDGDTQ